MKKEKTFLHIDGDSFFVACAVALNPELEGKPVVTGRERGIATAISYEAKALGITRAMSIAQIKREFPQVIVVDSDYSAITIFSKRMINIVRRFSPRVEEYSIDECFADLTNLYAFSKGDAISVARKIQKEIEENLNISVSVGLGPTKVLAKLASNFKKPHGFTVITSENKKQFLKQTPIEKVWGIGRQTSAYLKQIGIRTAQDFTELSDDWMKLNLSKNFSELWHELKGNSVLGIETREEAEAQKSISKTGSFNPPSRNPIYVFAELSKNIENACAKMRKAGLRGKRAVMFVKRQDFKYYSIECVVPHATNSPEAFINIAKERFSEIFKKDEDYRATGFTVYDLTSSARQKDLFGESENVEKFETIHSAIDSIDQFFGKHTVHLATTHLATTAKALISKTEAVRNSLTDSFSQKNDKKAEFLGRFAIPFGGVVI